MSKDLNTKQRNLVIITLLIGTFCTVLNQTILTTALPTLMKDLSVTASTIQWLTTGFLLVNGIMIPMSGWLMNQFNTKYLYITALFIFLMGTIICSLATKFPLLLTGRLVQAVGVGISMPLLQTVLLTLFPKDKRGAAMGLAGIVIGLAPAIGPTLSGFIIDKYSWRILFLIVIPIIIAVIIMSFLFMRPVLENNKTKLDYFSIVTSTLGFGSLLYSFSSVSSKGWGSFEVLACLALGIICITAFVRRQFKLPIPFLDLSGFKQKNFLVSCVLVGIASMAMISFETVIPMYIQEVKGETALVSGLILLPGAVIMGLMNPITGKIFDKYGARYLAIVGMLLLILFTFPFIFVKEGTSISIIVILYAFRLLGISMVMMPVTTFGMNALQDSGLSSGTAVNSTVRQLASSLGTAVMISVMSTVANSHSPSKTMMNSVDYKNKLITAKLDGYHSSFLIATIFGIMALFFAFRIEKKAKTNETVGRVENS